MEQVEVRGITLSEEVVEDILDVLPDVYVALQGRYDEVLLNRQRLDEEMAGLEETRGEMATAMRLIADLLERAGGHAPHC